MSTLRFSLRRVDARKAPDGLPESVANLMYAGPYGPAWVGGGPSRTGPTVRPHDHVVVWGDGVGHGFLSMTHPEDATRGQALRRGLSGRIGDQALTVRKPAAGLTTRARRIEVSYGEDPVLTLSARWMSGPVLHRRDGSTVMTRRAVHDSARPSEIAVGLLLQAGDLWLHVRLTRFLSSI